MKAMIFTFVVMTVIVLGLPAVELLVIKYGWGAFIGLVVLLLAILTTTSHIMLWLERICVLSKGYRLFCYTAIIVGTIKTIDMLWEVKPEDSGSLGMSTAIALTVFALLYGLGLFGAVSGSPDKQ